MTTDVSIYSTDTNGMTLPREWNDALCAYQLADWRAAVQRGECWIVRRDPDRPELVIAATAPAGATERVVEVLEG